MAERLSRRKIARYVAHEAATGAPLKKLLQEVAAYLVEVGQTREYELLVRDIEDALSHEGIVVADVTTAEGQTLPESMLKSLVPHAKQLAVRNHTDADLLGGALIELPGKQFDASLRARLTKLRSLEG